MHEVHQQERVHSDRDLRHDLLHVGEERLLPDRAQPHAHRGGRRRLGGRRLHRQVLHHHGHDRARVHVHGPRARR